MTFGQISKYWLEACVKRYRPKTCRGKGFIIGQALDFWGYDPRITDLSTLLVENFLNSVQSGKTANRYRRELRNLFNYATSRGIHVKNFAKDISPFREEKYKRYVPPAEDIETAMAFAEPMERDILTVLYNTAARAGEVRKLKWEDVNLEKREITLWTGKRSISDRNDDTLEMTNTLHDLLTRLAENNPHKEYVFSLAGEPLEYWRMNEIMKDIHARAIKAGVEFKYFSLHCIRHHVAALLAYRLSLIEISKILRHRNISTTDAYLKTLVTIKTKGISVLDDIQKSSGEVISFQDAVNKKR